MNYKKSLLTIFPFFDKKLYLDIFSNLNLTTDWEYWDVQGVWTFTHEGHYGSKMRRTVRNRKSIILGKTQHKYKDDWVDGEFKHLGPIPITQFGCDECFDVRYKKEERDRKLKDLLDE